MVCVFAVKPVVERLPKSMRVALALFSLCLAAEQVVSHRKFAKTVIRPVDVTPTIEYRTAKFAENELRVAYPGSMAIWLNAFSDASSIRRQFLLDRVQSGPAAGVRALGVSRRIQRKQEERSCG